MSVTPKFLMKMDDTKYQTPEVSKKGAIKSAYAVHEQIMEGNMSAIQVAEMFKFVETTFAELKNITDERGKNGFTDLVREEIVKNAEDGKKMTTKNGSVFELMEAGFKTDYSLCGDPVWEYYSKQLKEIKEKLSEREGFLKTVKSVQMYPSLLNPETGEIYENVEIYPPATTSTSTFKQTILKG